MKKLLTLMLFFVTLTGLNAYAQSTPNSDALGEFARCNAMALVHLRNGGEITERNQRFFASAPADFDSNMKATFAQVNECRASNPSDGALHKKCADSLPKNRKIMYESFLKGNQMMTEAYAVKDKSKIGTYMLSCSK